MNPNLPTGEIFSEGSDLPPLPPKAPTNPAMSEDCVPVEALAMPDEGEQMETPDVGDLVNYQVTGKVTRIEGGQAYVKRETVNGQEIHAEPDADDKGGPSDGDADNMAALEADAKAMDQMGGY